MQRSLDLLKAVFYVNIVFLVLLAVPFLYTDPGPQTRTITLFALLPIVIMLLGSAVLTYFEIPVFES